MDPVQDDSGGRLTVTGHSHGTSHISGDLTNGQPLQLSQWWVDNDPDNEGVIRMFHTEDNQSTGCPVAPVTT